jgi:renal tumor antigen
MRKYRLVAKKGEGTFSEVLKAQNVKDGKYHAIKCMKNRFESIDQVNNLREIQALRRLSPHEHIITLEEVLYDQPTGRLALVFELMDANLYELIRGRRHYLNPQLIKSYMWQLMKSLDHMHKKGIFHRDIKPENILIESSTDIGKGLKLADFGSCRGIYSKQPYTEYISTRWYRAPECLLTDGYYGPEMDLWGAGCVMFEITSLYPLFPGSNEVDQISRIHKVLGTPSQEILQKFKSKGASHISFDFPQQKGLGIPQLIPHAPADGVELMVKLLKYDAGERISAREAMRHPYFRDIREQEARTLQQGQSVTNTGHQKSPSGSHHSPDHFSVGGKSVSSNNSKVSGQTQKQQKSLPTIAGNSGQHDNHSQQQRLQQQPGQVTNQSHAKYKQAQQSGMNASLPPIGGGLYSQHQQQMHHQQQLMLQQQQYMQQQKVSHYSNSQQYKQQRRKKYRMGYGQGQKNAPQAQPKNNQLSQHQLNNKKHGQENVMKAYGVPKQINGSHGDTQARVVPGGAGGSYGAHPSRHYVKKNSNF